MKKFLKIFGLIVLALVLLLGGAAAFFINRITNGKQVYETESPELPALPGYSVLIFSKTNAFRHGEAIEASLPVFQQIADQAGWSIFFTDNGAVHNSQQLAQFDVVVWNNVSGQVLTEEQRTAFRSYLEGGGGYVGIHAAGDFSHKWPWYYESLLGTEFTHHTLRPQFPEGTLTLEVPDSSAQTLAEEMPESWTKTEEWYNFKESPRKKGAQILYHLDEADINFDGSVPLLRPDRDFSMGEDHPIVWYKPIGAGRMFYSGLGHQGETFGNPTHQQLLRNAISWAGKEE